MGGPVPAAAPSPQPQQQPFAGLGGGGGAPMAGQQSRLPKKAADPFADLLG